MTPEENGSNTPDINEFLKSIQNESPAAAEPEAEAFAFNDDFDIDAFAAADHPLEKTLTSVKAQDSAAQDFDLNTGGDLKEQTIKNLEEKIAELESRFEDASKEKSGPAALEEGAEDKYTPAVKANDEFYKNISSTIENLKGSLENIVSARLQYEENLIRQDATLITRLRDKTSRLKAINLALNSEVKRAKNEKLEHLRRSAEQTKELLALRMQLSKVEEKAQAGDFKLSNLEQQISFLNTQKMSLDEEVLKIREDKLSSLRKTAEQTREIMSLRLELGRTEEKFKNEELQSNILKDQLKNIETQRAALDNELYSTRSQREEANRKSAALEREVESLKSEIANAQQHLRQEASLAGSLREKIISLETEFQRLNDGKAAELIKSDAALGELEPARQQHERDIARLQAAQVQEIEAIKTQKSQEAHAVALELKRAEDKYRQEEAFVNTLKMQISSLRSDIGSLDNEKAQLKNKSSDLAREIEFIKSNHRREIENLTAELKNAQDKFTREQSSYNTLSAQLSDIEAQKNSLARDIAQILAAKEDALRLNDAYAVQIRAIKEEHNKVIEALKADIARLQETSAADKESESAIAILKSEISAMAGQRLLIDNELKKANTERYEILKKLEERTKEFDFYRKQYEGEISSLRDEKVKQANDYRIKLEAAETRARDEEARAADLRSKITALNAGKSVIAALPVEDASSAPAEEIISLKTQLARAESRFLQDTVLVNQLKEQFTKVSATANSLEGELIKLREENAQTRKDLTAKGVEISALKAALAKTQQQLQQEEEAVKQLQGHTAKLKAVNIALDREVKKVQAEKLSALKKSAEQANEILALKQQLSKFEGINGFDFENGIISIRKEYEAKVENLETQLKDVSARFAEQVREIQSLNADNTRLKNAEQQKIQIESEYKLLAEKSAALEDQLKNYQAGAPVAAGPDLNAIKVTALTAQIAKIKRDKSALEEKLAQMHQQVQALAAGEREKNAVLNALKEKIHGNDALIEKLKKDIVVLTVENKDLKLNADMTIRRERVLEAKISEVESEKKKLETSRTQPVAAALTQPAAPARQQQQQPPPAPQPAPTVNKTIPPATPAPQPKTEKANAFGWRIIRTEPAPAPETTKPPADNPEITNIAVKTVPPKRQEGQITSIMDFAEPKESREVIDVQSEGLDVSMVFGNDVEPDSTQRIDAAPQSAPQQRPAPRREERAQDHGPRAHGIVRKPVGRVPQTFQESAAYSDFLKKTRSVFYRIKWSLFNDQQ